MDACWLYRQAGYSCAATAICGQCVAQQMFRGCAARLLLQVSPLLSARGRVVSVEFSQGVERERLHWCTQGVPLLVSLHCWWSLGLSWGSGNDPRVAHILRARA